MQSGWSSNRVLTTKPSQGHYFHANCVKNNSVLNCFFHPEKSPAYVVCKGRAIRWRCNNWLVVLTSQMEGFMTTSRGVKSTGVAFKHSTITLNDEAVFTGGSFEVKQPSQENLCLEWNRQFEWTARTVTCRIRTRIQLASTTSVGSTHPDMSTTPVTSAEFAKCPRGGVPPTTRL